MQTQLEVETNIEKSSIMGFPQDHSHVPVWVEKPEGYQTGSMVKSDWTPENWMGSLDENKLLSALTIPGTHETCSLYGGSRTECQRLSLSEQLNAGIRAIDIRCRHFNNAFTIHHGAVYQNKNFTDVLNDCKAFLDSHPKECIVMIIKDECTGKWPSCINADNDRTFEDTFNWYLEQDKDYFYLDNAIPQLKDVQKKIVLICRFRTSRLFKGIAPHWEDDKTFSTDVSNGTLKIQDQYKVRTILHSHINNKWNSIKNLLDEARNDASKNNWYINFSSGSSGGAHPNAVASRINHRVSSYVEDKSLANIRLGTIMTDFPDENGKTDMINRIIGVNFR